MKSCSRKRCAIIAEPGSSLPPEKRKEVEQLRKELSKLGPTSTPTSSNAKAPVVFTKAELEGVPDSFFSSPGVKTGDDAYTVMANVTWQYITRDGKREERGDSQETLRHSRLVSRRTRTSPVLNQMLALRNKIALRLGYKSWDDYQTEIKMAKSGAGAKTTSTIWSPGSSRSSPPRSRELQKLKVGRHERSERARSASGIGATTPTS